jgi:hypothetical protein
MAEPGIQSRLADLGLQPQAQGPAALAAFLAEERAMMSGLIAAENIRLD